jgi:hypothetical protein
MERVGKERPRQSEHHSAHLNTHLRRQVSG